jgi:predicted MFS family arabinose efflux permease
VTGLIAQILDWRAAYWCGAVSVTAALVLAAAVLPPRSAAPSRRFDVVGAGLLSLAIIGISVVLSAGGDWGWASARSLGVVVASVVLLAVWIPFELPYAEPLVDLRQVRNRSVLTADIAGFLISIAMYLADHRGVRADPAVGRLRVRRFTLVSGLVLIPLSAGSFVASRLLVVYERRFGPRTMIPLGSAVFALAAQFFAFEHSALWEAFATVAICGLGVGFTTGAMPGFIVRTVTASPTGASRPCGGLKAATQTTATSPVIRRALTRSSVPCGSNSLSGPALASPRAFRREM